ncbi:MAG: hypothetical protein ACLFRI_05640 [Candidatus Izemoplasmataceae bacterium]
MRVSRQVGYWILSFFVVVLFGLTLWNLILNNILFSLLFLFFNIGTFYSLFKIYKSEVAKKSPTTIHKDYMIEASFFYVGSSLTYLIHNNTVLCIALSSALVGLIGALFIKKYQVAIYCGSFVGMSSGLLLSFIPFLAATLLAALIYAMVKDLFNGVGGKLGTIALSGALVTVLFTRSPFLEGSLFNTSEQLFIIGISVIASTLTFVINNRLKQGAVLASALTGFLMAGIFRVTYLDLNVTFGIVAIGASFVGMANQTRMKDERYIALAGVLFGLIFIYSAPYFGGAGGKLGTIAFLSVLSIMGITDLTHILKLKLTSDKTLTSC